MNPSLLELRLGNMTTEEAIKAIEKAIEKG